MRQNQLALQKTRFGLVQFGITALTLTTAIVHLQLAATPDARGLNFLFMLNGVGYISLLLALYIPQTAAYHRIVRVLLMGYTALTIVLWAIITRPYDPADFPFKLVEILLIALLIVEDSQAHKHKNS